MLVNPTNAANTEANLQQLQPAGETLGAQIEVVRAASSREIDASFAEMMRDRPDVLCVMGYVAKVRSPATMTPESSPISPEARLSS